MAGVRPKLPVLLALGALGLLLMAAPFVALPWFLVPSNTPEVMATAPSFQLIDQEGRRFDSRSLQGKVWVANFIFTTCPTVCPKLSQAMAQTARRFEIVGGERFKLVSFSVDPETDTPAVLKSYATKYEANPEQWTFLTGELDALKTTIVDGFMMPMGDAKPGALNRPLPAEAALMAVAHGVRLILVDPEGQVRGYYEADAAGLERLAQDAAQVLGVKVPPLPAS